MYLSHFRTRPCSKSSLLWLYRITERLLMLLVSRRNYLFSPRSSELTLGRLLIVISCHLISSRFSFARSSLLIHLAPVSPSWGLHLSLQTLSLVNKDAQTDSLAPGLVGRDALEGTSGDNFKKGQPNFLNTIKINPK